jgi:hypothetical protein
MVEGRQVIRTKEMRDTEARAASGRGDHDGTRYDRTFGGCVATARSLQMAKQVSARRWKSLCGQCLTSSGSHASEVGQWRTRREVDELCIHSSRREVGFSHWSKCGPTTLALPLPGPATQVHV